jgi:hypothetical protein
MQVAILIFFPLVVYYRRVDLRTSQIILCIAVVYAVWCATYSPVYELRHLVPAVVMDEHVVDIQLFPHFLKGELSGGHITTQHSSARSEFVIVLFTYLTDALLAILGAVVLMKLEPRPRPMIFGLLLTILVTSPLFDVVNNYVAFLAGARNDFEAISYTTSVATAHAIGIVGTVVTLTASGLTLWLALRRESTGEKVRT